MQRRLTRAVAGHLAVAGVVFMLSGCGPSHSHPRGRVTRVYMEVVSTALQGYYLEYLQYPFETDPPTQQGRTVSAAADELVAKDKLTRRQADENRLDAWGGEMLYLLYNHKQEPHPVVVYVKYSGLPSGNWSARINALMASGDIDWKSSHPIIGSAGADGKFGTEDDVYNVRSD